MTLLPLATTGEVGVTDLVTVGPSTLSPLAVVTGLGSLETLVLRSLSSDL